MTPALQTLALELIEIALVVACVAVGILLIATIGLLILEVLIPGFGLRVWERFERWYER